MSRRATFLIGRSGSGKTRAVHQALAGVRRGGGRALLIVPEQFTFETERSLSMELGGLLGVEVLSLERLAQRVLTLSGGSLPYLNALGERMVLRRSVLKRREELTALGGAAAQAGFCQGVAEIFRSLRSAGVAPQALSAAAFKLPPETLLAGKLHDIALLYQDVSDYLAGRYLTLEDGLEAAALAVPGSFIQDVPVYFDGLPAMTGRSLKLIKAVMDAAGEITFTLRLDPDASDGELFAPEQDALDRLQGLAQELGTPVFTQVMTGTRRAAPELIYMERSLFAHRAAPYPGRADALCVCGGTDRSGEAEFVADRVLEDARRGMRWRDIAVLASDMDGYAFLLERALRQRGVPVFVDQKLGVAASAPAQYLLFALNGVCRGFAPDQVLGMLKTGYGGVAEEDVFALENYVLRYGIRGGALLKPFARGEVPPGAERARETAMARLLPLREGLKGRTVTHKVRALYAFMADGDMRKQVEADAQALLARGQTVRRRALSQTWNLLMELMSQLDTVLGDVAMGREEFAALFEEGLSGCQAGVMPETQDAVLLGELHRTRGGQVRSLYMVGASEGLLPGDRGDDGLIDDRELTLLAEAGLELWNGTAYYAALDRLDLYAALSRATEKITFTYPYAVKGQELRCAPVVNALLRLFPGASRASTLEQGDGLPASASGGLTLLAEDLRAWREEGLSSPRTGTLMEYYSQSPATACLAGRMHSAARLDFLPGPVSPQLARALYGERVVTSASRLEQFNACPFKHFMRYSLGAKERPQHRERAADLGSFYHDALCAFTRLCLERRVKWKELSPEECDLLMDEVLPQVIAQHNEGIFLDNDRLRAALFLIVNVSKQSARAVARQLAAGTFAPLGAELRFGPGEAFPPLRLETAEGTKILLTGVIDRADAADTEAGRAVRVVDYKTAGRRLDFAALAEGLTLQLPLYLAAAGALEGEDVRLKAGLYYMPVRTPAPPEGDDAQEAMEKSFRLSGLTLSDPEIIAGTEAALDGNSLVVAGLRRNRDGAVKGPLCSPGEMERLLALAREKAAATVENILMGQIRAVPVEGTCQSCDYRAACKFDPGIPVCRTRKIRPLDGDGFFGRDGGTGDGTETPVGQDGKGGGKA